VTYDSAWGHMTVTSQHKDLPLCHGTSVRPSGLFASVQKNPVGLFVTGVPAEAKHRATKSLRACCLADLPGAFLQTKLWSPRASTGESHWHWCGMQRSRSNLKPTPTVLSPPHHLISIRTRRCLNQTSFHLSIVLEHTTAIPEWLFCR